jgi:myo-inositol 2-dehydrogenase / D-chiro-inositol 1-dehydrogenase
MNEPVRIGFIGCGGNARGHMHRLKELEGARIVGVCDLVEAAAASAAERTGSTAYTDHRRLLERDDLDAVYLSLPVFAHGQPEFDVIERGLPFLVEKPVARDMDTAREVAARVAKAGLLTAAGYQLRYAGTVDTARRELAGKRIGLVVGRYWSDTGIGDPKAWLRQMARSGGQLLEQATHTIDMMRYLVGEVSEVYCAAASQVLKDIDCPDFTSAAIKFENGAVGSLSTSWASSIGWNNTNVIELMYENSMLRWTYDRLDIHRDGKAEESTGASPDLDEVFVRAVRTNNPGLILSPYADAVRSLAISLALNQSAAEDRPVRLSELLGN